MTTFVNNDVQSGNIIYAADHNEQGARVAAVLNGGIDSANLADASVSTAKIIDASVTQAKLSTTSGEIGGAWASWTPAITNSGGSVTATTPVAKYTRIGKTIHYKLTVSVSAVSAAGILKFALPVTAVNDGAFAGSGREDALTGKMVQVLLKASATVASIYFYDNTGNTATAGYYIAISGTYEAA